MDRRRANPPAARDGTLSEIAYDCSCESLSYVSRLFRQACGVLPSESTSAQRDRLAPPVS